MKGRMKILVLMVVTVVVSVGVYAYYLTLPRASLTARLRDLRKA